MKRKHSGRVSFCLAFIIAASVAALGAPARSATCQKIVLNGQVTTGQDWKAPFGQGWVFRVIPIAPGQAGYSGWDLVVDREQPAGFPDALLVATPPYNSINEHEVGTTFGLRAQDAIGWNPRTFHFLTDLDDFRESQKLFPILSARHVMQAPAVSPAEGRAIQRQLKTNQKASAGQFRILDAHIAPGVSDAASYAEPWALASPRTKHSIEQSSTGKSTDLGELHWVQFSVTLWLPANWKLPAGVAASPSSCSE